MSIQINQFQFLIILDMMPKENDNRYFKYLRSLVAGHPIETSLDGSYINKGDKHFSPYIQRAHQTGSNVNIRIYSTSKNSFGYNCRQKMI